ncbi:hypothetical protein [Blastomonas fulva]|jgi:O-antigen/teichoic acid export membrane protein|uniref:hypothetical protein n=1 Tax=Blastomonas fulva TaxID=1550728 RepID=UPI003D2A6756
MTIYRTVMAKASGLASFAGVASGNAVATAISFLGTIVLARGLAEGDFVLVNTIVLIGMTISVAGGGVDSAASRMIAAQSAAPDCVEYINRSAARWRTVILFGGWLVAVPFLQKIAADAGYSFGKSVVMLFSCAVIFSGLAFVIIKPLAQGRYLSVFLQQVSVQVSIFCIFLAAALTNNVDIILYSLPFLIVWIGFLTKFSVTKGGELKEGVNFNEVAKKLTIGSVFYAVFDKIDVYFISYVHPDLAAEYAVAARFAGSMVLISSAYSAIVLPAASRSRSFVDILEVMAHYKTHFLAVVAFTLVCAVLGWFAIPILFGAKFAYASIYAALMLIQFPVISFYIILVFGLTNIGKLQWQVNLGAILVLCKIVVLPVMYFYPIVGAISGAIAHMVGACYMFAKAKGLDVMNEA